MLSKWDYRFMALAELVGTWSKDTSTKVGAVIADKDNRVVSVGYNGFPRGVEDSDTRYRDRDLKLSMVIHAEENALLFSNKSLLGCTVYVHPLPTCSSCAAKIIQSGISRVVHYDVDENSRWSDSAEIARTMYTEAGVEVLNIRRDV